jgi:hypothetical protein
MSQLLTLIWLKWSLFRNSLRTSKAKVNRLVTLLAILAALSLALLIAIALGFAAYALSSPSFGLDTALRSQRGARAERLPSAEFIFFSIIALCYLVWSTLPLSIGSNRQFDPGNLLLYPISFRKLFALDVISELASLQSIFAVPAIIAIGLGAGLGRGNIAGGLLIAGLAVLFGVALSKWISASVGSLIRKKRARGETLIALIGLVVALGGALFGQIAPVLFRHAESITMLRWTPPGAIAYALTHGIGGHVSGYVLALAALSAYTVALIGFTYWLERRALLGGGPRRRSQTPMKTISAADYSGWEIPLLSPALSAVVEKELRYLLRNAQVRMMMLMPLLLIVVRLLNRRRFDQAGSSTSRFASDFFFYGEGLMATVGVLYVFLILSGLFCNQFAFEHAGMRTLILSPVARKTVLLGKNIALATLAFLFSAVWLIVNGLVFRDLTLSALLFVALSWIIFALLMSVVGNALSVRFPKRMKFGKRLNVSGAVGLLLIPVIVLLMLPPLAATAAGYIGRNVILEYVTLGVLALLSLVFYWLMIEAQGESLQRREREILEAVNEPGNE